MTLPLVQVAPEHLWRKQVTAKLAALVTGVSSVFGRTGAVVATAGDYTATQITNTPAGGIAATNVQAALNELDGDKFPQRTISGTANQITVTNGSGASGNPTLALAVGDVVAAAYTPTLTAVANVDSATNPIFFYMRVGSVVTVAGRFTVDTTAAASTTTSVGISLPFASDFSTNAQCVGTGQSANIQEAGRVIGDTTNDRATAQWLSQTTGSRDYYCHFTYIVL